MSDQERAFPTKIEEHKGMTLRDYFAAKAMQAALAGAVLPGLDKRTPGTMAAIATMATGMYVIADAMVAARMEKT